MITRYGAVGIAITVLAFSILRFATDAPSRLFSSPCPGLSHEAILACGDKIPLTELSMNDAQLLSSIPEKSLQELISNRSAVISHSYSLPNSKRYKALEMIDGIGEVRAIALANWVDFK